MLKFLDLKLSVDIEDLKKQIQSENQLEGFDPSYISQLIKTLKEDLETSNLKISCIFEEDGSIEVTPITFNGHILVGDRNLILQNGKVNK